MDRVPGYVKEKIMRLQTGSPRQKVSTARDLGKMGYEAAPSIPYLIELIDSPETYQSLGNKWWNTFSILGGSVESVMVESQQALVRIGRPSVDPLSAALLKHPRSRVRGNSARVLGGIKDLASIDPLIAALKTDMDYEVRMWSAEALGRYAEKWSIDTLANTVPALMEALRNKNSNIRQKAAYALGRIKAIKAVPGLIEELRNYGGDSDAGLALSL